MPVQIQAIGNVEAYQTVLIRSQVNGQIDHIFFKEGDDVHQGQRLFQLDESFRQIGAVGQMKRSGTGREFADGPSVIPLEKQGIVSHEQVGQVLAQSKRT